MPYGQNTHPFRLVLALVILVAFPAGVIFAASDDDLVAAKDEFNSLWHSAAETTKKRSELEQNLAQFDSKVASARKDLATAAEQRKAVREQMTEHKGLIDALQGQIAAAQQAEAFYQAVASSQKEDFADFIRYMVSRNIADAEAGPAAASPLFKRILHGSLGEAIEDQMARDAVLAARQRFFDQVRVLVLESNRVQSQLHSAATEISAELGLLEKQHSTISSLMDEKEVFIDNSWKQKKLTEAEIAEVAQESAEASARIAGMQVSLLQINDELKEGKVKALKEDLARLEAKQKDAESRRDSVKLKDQAIAMLEDNALHAFQSAMQGKGTDKKLYQRIEELKLKRGHDADALLTLKARASASGSDAVTKEIAVLTAKIAHTDEVLKMMKDGIPQDLAEDYIDARRQADQSAPLRAEYAKQIVALSAEAASALQGVSAKVAQIDDVSKQYELSDLPPIFLWPVSGPITAGYYDVTYEEVFHVPHRAVDIAVPQASPVRSISDGVVYAVKDGGARGFSYILIAHRNGYASLYGHVSSSFVSNGTVVNAGQIIGLSGGTPGTHGAGSMTTGAHLHIEITKNGVHVNPLSVLPSR